MYMIVCIVIYLKCSIPLKIDFNFQIDFDLSI